VYLLASGQPGGRSTKSSSPIGSIRSRWRSTPTSAFNHYYNGRYQEAVAQLQSVLAMKSDFLLAHLWLARALLELRRFDAALAATAVAESKARDWSVLVTARGFTYAMAGKTSEARAVLREMDALARQRFVTSYGIALVHAGLEHKDEAFSWLDRASRKRSHWLVCSASIRAGRICTTTAVSRR